LRRACRPSCRSRARRAGRHLRSMAAAPPRKPLPPSTNGRAWVSPFKSDRMWTACRPAFPIVTGEQRSSMDSRCTTAARRVALLFVFTPAPMVHRIWPFAPTDVELGAGRQSRPIAAGPGDRPTLHQKVPAYRNRDGCAENRAGDQVARIVVPERQPSPADQQYRSRERKDCAGVCDR